MTAVSPKSQALWLLKKHNDDREAAEAEASKILDHFSEDAEETDLIAYWEEVITWFNYLEEE